MLARACLQKGFLPSSLPFMSPFQWFGTLVWCAALNPVLCRPWSKGTSEVGGWKQPSDPASFWLAGLW